tara:strand:+ start:1209 stop:2321 length:1113 start_codon:yes stop_codon:yes gene_type:complete
MKFKTQFKKVALSVEDPSDNLKEINLHWHLDNQQNEDDLNFDADLLKNVLETSSSFKTKRFGLRDGSRHRWGSFVNLNDQTYWTLILSARALQTKFKKKIPVPKIIDFLVNNSLCLTDTSAQLGEVLEAKDLSQEKIDSKQVLDHINSYFKKYILIKNKANVLSVPKLTYHPVPAVRSLFLLLIEPQLIDLEDIFEIISVFKEFCDIPWVRDLERQGRKIQSRVDYNAYELKEYKAKRRKDRPDQRKFLQEVKMNKERIDYSFKENYNPASMIEFIHQKNINFEKAYEAVTEEDMRLSQEFTELRKLIDEEKYESKKRGEHIYRELTYERKRRSKTFLITRYTLDEFMQASEQFNELKKLEKIFGYPSEE